MPKLRSGLRQLLDCLTQQQLLALADTAEIPLSQRQVVVTIRHELWKKKGRLKQALPLILGDMSLSTLKWFCETLDLDSSGNKKIVLQERLSAFLDLATPSEASNDGDDADTSTSVAPISSTTVPSRPKIFIVHGHDFGMRKDIEYFLARAEIDAIVLSQQASGGKTIIEQLEAYINPNICRHAIVLFSPDDVGHQASHESAAHARARQNVMFEYGMVVGRLGRKNVTLLHRGNVEIPSDIHGLIWIRYEHDAHDGKLKLARELVEMGYKIDFNKAFQ